MLDKLADLDVRMLYKLSDGRELDASELKAGANGVEGMDISVLLIVDDTTLVADKVEDLQEALEIVHAQFDKYGLGVNVKKSFATAFAWRDSAKCVRCGLQDGKRAATALCDGCDAAYHTTCMIETERARWDAVEGTALPWHCDACEALDDVSTAVSVARPPLAMGGGPLSSGGRRTSTSALCSTRAAGWTRSFRRGSRQAGRPSCVCDRWC